MGWTPDLAVGVTMIDEEHKQLFAHADKLFDAGKNHQAKEYVGELLNFLDGYTRKHFGDEEQYMQRIHYPEYPQQKQAHEYFIKKLEKLKQDYAETGGNILVVLNANQLILDWLTVHISKMDKKLGEYAKTMEK